MEKEKSNNVKQIINKVLLELSKPIYNIESKKLKNLYVMKEKIQIIISDKKEKEIKYNFYYASDGMYCGTIKLKNWNRSFLLEYPPVYRNHTLCSVNPIINIASYDNEKKFILAMYHEVSHLFSSSEWKSIDGKKDCLEHRSGICIDRYYYSNGQIFNVESNHLEPINEALNDWVSKYLYSKIENKMQINDRRFEKINNKIEEKIKKSQITPEQIIEYYFSNDTDKLISIINIEDLIVHKNVDEERF